MINQNVLVAPEIGPSADIAAIAVSGTAAAVVEIRNNPLGIGGSKDKTTSDTTSKKEDPVAAFNA